MILLSIARRQILSGFQQHHLTITQQFFRCKVEAASPTGTTLSELAALTERLLADNRVEDAKLAARDEKVRERLYREYGIER